MGGHETIGRRLGHNDSILRMLWSLLRWFARDKMMEEECLEGNLPAVRL